MNEFTIRDIENLCGIKAHTLRMWEQRYQFRIPKRKPGNHRLYDSEDLKYLLRIAFLYHNGHKISSLARLDENELCQLAFKIPLDGGANDIFINHLIEATLDFDQNLFDRVLHNVILHMGFEKAITQVAYPFLNKIGLLWLTGNVVPAQEHFAGALIIKKLLVAINGLESSLSTRPNLSSLLNSRPGSPVQHLTAKVILLYTPKGEFHEIPLLYMRYLMKKNGLSTVYFGKDASLEDLRHYCSHKPVTHLYFHLVTNLLRCEPGQYVKGLTEYFPDKQIVVSGIVGASLQQDYPQVRVLRDLAAMEAFARGN